MRLIFVHGWGFDTVLWNGIAEALPQYPQRRIDLGFLGGAATVAEFSSDDVLIGHSLGFLWGLRQQQNWRQVIAINGFARFAGSPEEGACVGPAALRAMRLALARDAGKALATFYRSINHTAPCDRHNATRLAEGLALLETEHIEKPLAVPCRVLATRNDPLVPKAASDHLAAITGGSILWSDEGGHLLPLTRPQWCADAIEACLA